MPLVTIRISDNAAAVATRFARARPVVLGAIVKGLDLGNVEAVANIKTAKLTAAGPKYLNVRTGRLRRSARATAARISGDKVQSTVGSNVAYAAFHEYGFNGTEKVGAFTRKIKTRNVSAKVDGKRKKIASGVAFVKPFSRKVNARGRRMFGDGIDEKQKDGTYSKLISTAILAEFGRT